MASKGRKLYVGYLLCLLLQIGSANSETDTLLKGQKLKSGGKLVSAFGKFRLEFFSEGGKIYLGIFYDSKNYDTYVDVGQRAVWVANLNNPIIDDAGVLSIVGDGNLKILTSLGNPVPISSVNVSGKTCATLLDTGNLVLNELNLDGSVKRLLWQSFDYPTDTLLPGMKIGINLRNGHTWSLSSGSFSLGLDHDQTNQLMIWWAGDLYWTSGVWLNGKFNLAYDFSDKNFLFSYVSNEDEKYFFYQVDGDMISAPKLVLDYGSLVDSNGLLSISCLGTDKYYEHGNYKPSVGCVLKEYITRRKHPHDFVLERGLVSGKVFEYNESYRIGTDECRYKCETNCSCVAYAPKDDTAKESGCQIWSNETVETSTQDNWQGIYVLVNRPLPVQEHKDKVSWLVWLAVAMGGAVALALLFFVVFIAGRNYNGYFKLKYLALQTGALHLVRTCEKKFVQYIQSLKKKDSEQEILLVELGIDTKQNLGKSGKFSQELKFLSFESVVSATNNFGSSNKLGEGGFGPVYEGQLPDGQQVAIKRLSRNSKQGLAEFKNEVKVIAKLQHNNLVRLVGCCIEKEEKMLIYEFMPNKSLDFFLFYSENENVLDWKKRFNIVEGISQGLLYLHKYSRLKIIHRDLKASNILLDREMNPKISDFGMAKIFGPDESKANTIRVVGTFGYMSPEYAREGLFSTKSDVFSFGVLLLEIVSGRKNNSFGYSDSYPSLTAFAWELWKQARELELVDHRLDDLVCQNEVLRCIHVGLLCVQENPADRPTMLDVISMLYNEANKLPSPKEPAFYYSRRNFPRTEIAEQNQEHTTSNDVSITEKEAM